ncbi:EAL domain-containing protein [Bordetella genomosp. 1]|uniref:cyclic-guanylate-specific phosphodiesterase n=1 Tax=Bordetella genomosp. 1 TaxID=1395607 RepID=A0ABX4EZA7_9BORD|nr:EAL domain-containing protein [Bordetella genomosp. 1]OZI65083.1 hypothetical protein CAL27_08395 [Bordetella genomosp. 1]
MPARTIRFRASFASVLLLLLAALVPVMLAVLLSWVEARRHEHADATVAANVVRNQVDNILDKARYMVDQLVPLTALSCPAALPELRRMSTSEPYFRSLMLLQNDRAYCSAAVGMIDLPITDFPNWPLERMPGQWMALIPGTALSPNRPALLVAEPGLNGRSVVAIIDGQYLLDLLRAVAPLGEYRIELRLGQGMTLSGSARGEAAPRVADVLLYQERARGKYTETAISIWAPDQKLRESWTEALWRFVPVGIIIGALLVWLCYRLQQSESPARVRIARAIRANEFRMHYQPIYGLASGKCEGVEALVRWFRPGETIRPDLFIPMAEAEGMIVPLTQHLLGLVAADLEQWDIPPGFRVAVNFHASHLSDPVLLDDVRNFMEASATRQPTLVLEITERSLVDDAGRARHNIEVVRGEGVRVAIDDFGTGYCSLTYLERFPVDYLKVDIGFVRAIEREDDDAPVLDAIIGLAQRLDLGLVAEGVETVAQFNYLRARGVASIQGFLYARPMPAEEFNDWYASAGQQPPPGVAVAEPDPQAPAPRA